MTRTQVAMRDAREFFEQRFKMSEGVIAQRRPTPADVVALYAMLRERDEAHATRLRLLEAVADAARKVRDLGDSEYYSELDDALEALRDLDALEGE